MPGSCIYLCLWERALIETQLMLGRRPNRRTCRNAVPAACVLCRNGTAENAAPRNENSELRHAAKYFISNHLISPPSWGQSRGFSWRSRGSPASLIL